MAEKDFHESSFDESTLLKLHIFRGYIRRWFPVFLAKKSVSELHVFDFFCGPGTDKTGNPGSPLIVLDELEKYIEHEAAPLVQEVKVVVHFNDSKENKVASLRDLIENRYQHPRCECVYSSLEFPTAFGEAEAVLVDSDKAKLLIVDQCGLKFVTDAVFCEIARLPKNGEATPILRQLAV